MLKKMIADLITPTIEDRPLPAASHKALRTTVQGVIVAEVLGGTFAEKAIYTAYPFAISAAATAGAYSVNEEFRN